MFESVATSDSLHVRGSFWQFFKAGFAFTCGAMLAALIGGFFYAAVAIRVIPRIIAGL